MYAVNSINPLEKIYKFQTRKIIVEMTSTNFFLLCGTLLYVKKVKISNTKILFLAWWRVSKINRNQPIPRYIEFLFAAGNFAPQSALYSHFIPQEVATS